MKQGGRLVSSSLDGTTAIALVDTAASGMTSFRGVAVDNTTMLLAYARMGDANLSGTVDFDDLLLLAASYGQTTGAHWNNGDADYDGNVDFDDLLALAKNYGTGTTAAPLGASATFTQDWALARAVAPEPSLLAMAGFALMTRRRRSVCEA